MNDEKLSSEIENIALSSGAELVGFVSVDQFDEAPEGHRPSNLLSDAKSVIVLAYGRKLNEDRYYIQKSGRRYFLNFIMEKPIVRIRRKLATRCVNKVARFLENEGFKAVIEWCGDHPRFVLSFRRTACFAGLGIIGKGGFVIHPKLGPLNILALIVTNAPLEAGDPLNLDLCGECTKCIEICEYGAITQHGFDDRKCRVFDVYDPKNERVIYGPCNAECVNICPIGKQQHK